MNNNWSVIYQPNFMDVSDLVESPPSQRGLIRYNNTGSITTDENEGIKNSFARYKYPKYKNFYYETKKKLEILLEEKLHPTYYYDRFYFNGSELKKHTDRPACEISLSMNISGNLNYNSNLCFEVEGKLYELPTSPGDAIIYKGIDIPHWRNKIKGSKQSYYHQIFMHYVRANGYFVEYTNDML